MSVAVSFNQLHTVATCTTLCSSLKKLETGILVKRCIIVYYFNRLICSVFLPKNIVITASQLLAKKESCEAVLYTIKQTLSLL